MKKTYRRYMILAVIIFCVNFFVARFSPAAVKNNIWLSTIVVTVLDGIVLLLFGMIWHK